MAPDRPKWCAMAKCGCYHYSGRCVLRDWVLESTPLTKARRDKFADFRKLVEEDPGELEDLCRRKLSEVEEPLGLAGKVRRGRRSVS